jgi:hypothetical protein
MAPLALWTRQACFTPCSEDAGALLVAIRTKLGFGRCGPEVALWEMAQGENQLIGLGEPRLVNTELMQL